MKNATLTFKTAEEKSASGIVLDTILDNSNTRYLVEDKKGKLYIVAPADLTLVEAPETTKTTKETK